MSDKLAIAIILFIISFLILYKRKEENFEIRKFKQKGKQAKLIFTIRHYLVLIIFSAVISAVCMFLLTHTILE